MAVPPLARHIWDRIWDRYAIKYGITITACLLATWMQLQYRIPGNYFFVIAPAIGIALSLLSAAYLVSAFLDYWPQWDRGRSLLKGIEWSVNLVVRVFVYSSLLLYLNGKLDASRPVFRFGEITTLHKDAVPYPWATVRYRDEPGSDASVILTAAEVREIWGAEPVCVEIKKGALGIPVVVRIEQDWDSYARAILKLAPTASGIWKRLISFDLDHRLFSAGISSAQEYLKLNPGDYGTAYDVGYTLFTSRRINESIPFLEHAAAKHPTYDFYQSLGTALNWNGQKKRAAEILEGSIALRPEDWEAYYHLGYVYRDMGKRRESIAYFEKALERRPDFPEVREIIAQIQKTLDYEESVRRAKGKR